MERRGWRGEGRRSRNFKHRVPRTEASPHRPSTPSAPPSTDLVFGRRPVWEVLEAGKRSLHKLWVAEGIGGGIITDVLRVAKDRGVPVEWCARQRLDQMTQSQNHQGLVAQVSAIQYLELEEFIASLAKTESTLVVALDEIQDPHNIGAILRSAGFFGVAGVVVPRWRSAPVGDTAMRTSAGAVEHVPVVRVRNLADALLTFKEAGFLVIGTDAAGSRLGQESWEGPTVLVLGNEGEGLRRLVKERCDKLVGIPSRGGVASLNVGSATAIFLYEFFRSR